jgi:hypothetical protein
MHQHPQDASSSGADTPAEFNAVVQKADQREIICVTVGQ